MAKDIIVPKNTLPALIHIPPATVLAAGPAAKNAWRDFFSELELENENTYRAYNHAVGRFLTWCEQRGIPLAPTNDSSGVMPADVAQYIKDDLGGSPSTQKLHRSAIKRYFDLLVVRHICIINPAASVKTPRLTRTRGTTPMIEPDEIKQLMASINTTQLSGLRDQAIIAVLGYTAARAGGVARLRCGDYRGRPGSRHLYFREKGGNHREIEVRHDLEQCLDAYLTAARMKNADRECPLFRPLTRKEQKFRPWVKPDKTAGIREQGLLTPNDLSRMLKRRMRNAGLREELSAHSFRVAVLTDLIDQGVPIEDVQELAGHADARTTKLYDRTTRKASRNLVERIRLKLMPKAPDGDDTAAAAKVMRVELYLRVENNSKFVRGKKKAREEIEWYVLARYDMRKPQKDGWEYILTIPYETDEDLDETIYDILREAESHADSRNCFTEADVRSLDDPERSW